MPERPPTLADVALAPHGQGIHTFSNGTSWECWAEPNCYACRWWNEEEAGADCAFEGAALLGAVSPELARMFGWVRNEANDQEGETFGWEPPQTCPFFMARRSDDGGDDDRPDPPVIDSAQLTFLAPDQWPTVTVDDRQDAPQAVSV